MRPQSNCKWFRIKVNVAVTQLASFFDETVGYLMNFNIFFSEGRSISCHNNFVTDKVCLDETAHQILKRFYFGRFRTGYWLENN